MVKVLKIGGIIKLELGEYPNSEVTTFSMAVETALDIQRQLNIIFPVKTIYFENKNPVKKETVEEAILRIKSQYLPCSHCGNVDVINAELTAKGRSYTCGRCKTGLIQKD